MRGPGQSWYITHAVLSRKPMGTEWPRASRCQGQEVLATAFLAAAFLAVAFLAAVFFVAVFLPAAFLAAFLPAPFLLARGANSKPTLPSGCVTRNALNLRCVRLETKSGRRSVLPSASSFLTCSGLISCCRITLPVRKSQVLFGPVDFSQT